MALGRIKRSGGTLEGRGLAKAGLISGYVFTAIYLIIVPLLAVAGFTAGNAAIRKAKTITVLATATSIESAVNGFYMEYNTMPTTMSTETEINTQDNIPDFLNIVLGLEPTSGTPLNTKGIKFLVVKEGRGRSNGMIYDSSGTLLGLYDPWGGPYRVILDVNYDEKLLVNGEVVKGHRAAVWSDGPDRKSGTEDDVKTW